MRLEVMTVGLLRRAIALYLANAWRTDPPPAPALPASDDDPVTEALSALRDECRVTGGARVRCYTLRLGNPRYPFMKLVLQEHLVEDEFFLEVDTHDQMFELQGDEARQLEEVKRYNLDVKTRIEEAWSAAGLPTARDLKGLVATTPAPRAEGNGRRILVVDDDADIAQTLAMLLQARGYEVERLGDGMEAVERADASRHDLILMDNEMPRLSGFEACRVLKSRPETQAIPVLIATAGALTLAQLDDADGFLVKPFRAELLFSMLDHMLGRRGAG